MNQKNFYLHRLWNDARRLSIKNKIILSVSLALLVFGGFFLGAELGGAPSESELASEEEVLSQVFLASVRDLSQDKEPIRILGEVSSQSEASLKSEAQGRVTSVRVSEGQRVRRGQIIATIENATQVASVAQAQAAVASARAAIKTSQTLNQVGLQNSEQVLRESRIAALNTIETAYNQIDDAVRGQADTLFFNPETTDPRLIFVVDNNQQLNENLGIKRRNISKILSEWKVSIDALTESTVTIADLSLAEEYSDQVRLFLSDLVTASLGVQSSESVRPSQIATWRSAASGARSIVGGVIGSLSGARNSLVQAETSVQVSSEQKIQSSLTGNTTAQASVDQAEAALRSAQLNLAKTTISAPIDGVVTMLDVEVGDFVSILGSVATISSDQSLEIIAYLNDTERGLVGEGASVSIGENGVTGEVAQVASTIDTSTQKVEIKILPSTSVGLTDGQSVKIAIQRSLEDPDQIFVPLASLKVLPGGFSVLILDSDLVVESIPVQVGPVLGDRVLVYEGLSLDTQIITDVRGIKTGDKVLVGERE